MFIHNFINYYPIISWTVSPLIQRAFSTRMVTCVLIPEVIKSDTIAVEVHTTNRCLSYNAMIVLYGVFSNSKSSVGKSSKGMIFIVINKSFDTWLAIKSLKSLTSRVTQTSVSCVDLDCNGITFDYFWDQNTIDHSCWKSSLDKIMKPSYVSKIIITNILI